MSSVRHSDYSGSKAVDGFYLPSDSGSDPLTSLAYTNKELSPWIQVDLAINHYVDGVKIWNRHREDSPSIPTVFLFVE